MTSVENTRTLVLNDTLTSTSYVCLFVFFSENDSYHMDMNIII